MHSKIIELKNIIQFEQRSPEWFEQRKDKLTSSDASSVLGINPYSSQDELLYKKCGIDKPFIGNIATLHGQKYEDEAIELYCKITNRENYDFGLLCYQDVYKNNMNINEEHFFLAGSPDGIAINKFDNSIEPVLLEVKCPFRRPIKDGYIPHYYVPQVQLNLYICDLNIADFIEYDPFRKKINIVRIVRDQRWLDNNIPILYEFWDKVLYYRRIGIENYPNYIIKKKRQDKRMENKRKKELEKELELEKENEEEEYIINNIREQGYIISE